MRSHLLDLGYEGVTDERLNEFMHDLRRLIRYEEKQRRVQEQIGVLGKTRRKSAASNDTTISSSAYGSSSSLAAENDHSKIQNEEVDTARRGKPKRKIVKYRKRSTSLATASSQDVSEEDIILRINLPNQGEVEQRVSKFATKPTTSFIRPTIQGHRPAKDLKCDPVRLYEYYKRIWEQTNFPGGESSNQLRWTVREWMMGDKTEPKK